MVQVKEQESTLQAVVAANEGVGAEAETSRSRAEALQQRLQHAESEAASASAKVCHGQYAVWLHRIKAGMTPLVGLR